jgi:hypothetical protein
MPDRRIMAREPMEEDAMADQSTNARSPAMSLAVATTGDVRFNPGRRPEIKYRDLGVKDATGGRMRAEVMHIGAGSAAQPTGWHYHVCEMQFLYMLEGWVDLEFGDRGVVRLAAGDSRRPGASGSLRLRADAAFGGVRSGAARDRELRSAGEALIGFRRERHGNRAE